MNSLGGFVNEPALELRRGEVRSALLAALEQLDARLPLQAPIWIGDDRRDGEELVSSDPGAPNRVVGLAPIAATADIEQAIGVAAEASKGWAATDPRERSAALIRAAQWMRERRHELAALCVRECAKPWSEADGDVCEAIDALEFNARAALELAEPRALLQVPGEHNELRYVSRGVTAVIAPWNFPLAIPTGMTSAALATGNTVVLKPAEQSPACGAKLVEALRASGVPAGAVSLLPGDGASGASLVRDPRVQAIAFTGSVAVGLDILVAAAVVSDGQRHLKRVVAEMGGKNCAIVDADADLDEAVPAIVRSAFAYAGQKCSAVSRVLVHSAIADELLERLAGAVATLEVGQSERFETDVPPVIDEDARRRIERYAAIASSSGRIIARGANRPRTGGLFCEPMVVSDLPADSDLLKDEIFGPILSVERVGDIEDACDRVDSLPFALTGALFARNPHTVERVVARSPVGNLYVNRHTTGAMVGRQPFGGGRLSGTGAKTGGRDYLLQFVEPRVVTENTMRHGIAL